MSQRTTTRFSFVLATSALSSLALANGAMRLALEMFEYRTWAVYVVAMVALESWMIGAKGGYDWPQSILISIFANAITAFFCVQLVAVGLHCFSINPNPLLYVTELLFFFGLGSAYVESIIWRFFKPSVELPVPASRKAKLFQKSVVLRSLAAHTLGIPIALIILLSPPHPYKGLSALVFYQRRMALVKVMKSFDDEIRENGKVPDVHSLEEVIEKFSPESIKSMPDSWAIAYITDYTRFATGEQRRIPWEWNPKASGTTFAMEGTNPKPHGTIWLCRVHFGGIDQGFVLDRDGGGVHLSTDSSALGY